VDGFANNQRFWQCGQIHDVVYLIALQGLFSECLVHPRLLLGVSFFDRQACIIWSSIFRHENGNAQSDSRRVTCELVAGSPG
jgi:hypothetical protein